MAILSDVEELAESWSATFPLQKPCKAHTVKVAPSFAELFRLTCLPLIRI